jgi:hypothetical protein
MKITEDCKIRRLVLSAGRLNETIQTGSAARALLLLT